MTPKNKLKKVGEVNHPKSGIIIPYYLDGTQFVATVFETQMKAPDASILVEKIRERIEHWITLEWHPVIEVKVSNGYSGDNLSLEFERYYLSKGPAGSVLECSWEVDEVHRKAKAKWMEERECHEFRLTDLPLRAPLTMRGGHILPYSEQVWETLNKLQANIEHLKKQINDLITTKAGILKLERASESVLLLGSGK